MRAAPGESFSYTNRLFFDRQSNDLAVRRSAREPSSESPPRCRVMTALDALAALEARAETLGASAPFAHEAHARTV